MSIPYKGTEWFNVATGCLLLAIVYLFQCIWVLTGTYPGAFSHWSYFLVYFCGFLLVGLALIFDKEAMALSGAIIAFFFVLNDVFVTFQAGIPLADLELIRTGTAVISLILLAVAAGDYFGVFKKDINIKGSRHMIIGSFACIAVWAFLRLYKGLGSVQVWHSWLMQLLILGFCITSLLSMWKETDPKGVLKSVESETLNTIAFLFALGAIAVILVRWNEGSGASLFG